ncbi:MAG: tandem-95 repeat protein [Flavobacteriales bacterium]|nr:tandem-95 repeat protein [Flavobacteriales bacterium]
MIAGSFDVFAEDPPPTKDPVPSTLLVDFLKARSYTAPVIECRDQDYPVFGVDVKVFNLGPKINSGYSDYNPVLDKKESFLLFTSRRNIENGEVKDVDGQYYEKMMVSRRKNGVFQEAVPITQNDSLFGRLPSSERHESLIFLSYSEDLLITYTDEKLYYSNRIGDFYTEPVEFPKIINKGKWKRHASITEDGRKLYFTTESQSRVSKNLNLDIWEIERKDDGSWKRPQRISDVVNSPYNEDSPEISPDGRFIFFSSNRVGGMGGYDVYMAEKVDGEWQEPKNLCQPINTAGDDIYFKLSRNGNYAYYSSNALGGEGNMDVYKVVLDVPSIATCASYAFGRRTINYTSPFEIDFYGQNKEFFWAFGDGQTGVGASINHEYGADGDYQVVLYVRDKVSQRIVNTVFSKTVRVDTEHSSVDILGPDTAELGHEFHFDGTDSYVEGAPATAYYWKIDGQLVSREPEINYEFTRVGTHKIELEVGVLDERVMELSSACIAREVEVITPFEYSRTVGASEGSEGFSYSSIIPDQVLYDMGVKQNENPLDLENDYIKTWQGEAKSFSAFENDRSPGISLDKLIDVSKPMHGTVKVKNTNYGLLVYEPRSDFSGYDKFTYTARSKAGQIATATVVVSVMQRVDEMRGQNVTNDEVEIDVGEESVKIFPLQNDQHDLGSNQRIVDLSQPSNGTVQQLGLQGLLEYSPTASFQGTDAFTYTVQDEEGAQSTASVIIRSKDITKTKLYANPDYVEIKQGDKARVKVLENDVFKGKVNIISVGAPKHGATRVINPLSGDVFYGPDNDFVGTDAFTYTLEDEEGRRTATSVTVVVTENIVTNKPLVLETTQGTPVNAFIFEEFNIPAGYELSGKVNAKNGKVQVIDSKNGIVNYAPNQEFAGFEMFYVGVEKDGESLELGVIVKVKAVQSLMEKYGISPTPSSLM